MSRPTWHRTGTIATAAALCAATLYATAPLAIAGPAARAPVAAPWTDLIRNPGAEAGAASAQGWDAVTIPGWRVRRGLPTVVRYGTRGFPGRPVAGRRHLGRRLFAGGAGGTAELVQRIPLRYQPGLTGRPGHRFRLSGWFGGTRTSSAWLAVRFYSAAGKLLGQRRLRAVGGSGGLGHRSLTRRRARGVLPPGTRLAEVDLWLRTTLTDADGPDAPLVGYDRAVADRLSFSVSARIHRQTAVRPPAARVPRFRHVFLFYFENEDYGKIIGNTAQAPYLNRLLPSASVLASFYAEEHPSDGNYLALAGGSTFGIPLTDPLEVNPHYTIDARNLGDLVDAAGESWKGYLQDANGPCDDTVHGSYWDDDLPMLYFRDVRERPAYCAAHLVPLASLAPDLRRASSTPNFAWISPDDCADMEGCGIRAGDRFLARELGAILRSPAWTRQRSLAIITFDEDGYDHQHPAQRVPTIILGSRDVRRGYVSRVRYTHYSLLRTIEAALGLGQLTRNDLYAQPVNDVFGPAHGPAAAAPPQTTAAPGTAAARHSGPARRPVRQRGAGETRAGETRAGGAAPGRPAAGRPGGTRPRAETAFVVNAGSGTVTPIDLATRRAGRPIRVGADPQAIAVTPDGRTAYVANAAAGTVTPISTATRRAGRPIRVGADPRAIAVTPDGRTAYVADTGSDAVTPIDTATGRAGRPIRVGAAPLALAVAPGGRFVYVLNWEGGTVSPINTATNRAGRPIRAGSFPFAIAFARGGRTAYVANYGSDTVTPIRAATRRAGRPIRVGQAPCAIAVSPDGRLAYVVNGDSGTVTPIRTGTGRAGRAIRVGYSPAAVAVSRSGTGYVVNTISGTVTPLHPGRRPGRPINVGLYAYPTAIDLAPAGPLALVLGTYAGQVTLVNTATGHPLKPIEVGRMPVAAAVVR